MILMFTGLEFINELEAVFDNGKQKHKSLYNNKVSDFISSIVDDVLADIEGFVNNEYVPWERFDMIYLMLSNVLGHKEADERSNMLIYGIYRELLGRVDLVNGFKTYDVYPLSITNDER
jgi:hypothetical protein